MKGGVLEVLLVSANGLKHSHLLGCPSLYVVIQCGNETYNSRITSGKREKVWWNEKFIFKFPSPVWRSLTRLTMRIMKKGTFMENSSIGETIVHLGGILSEGSQKSCIVLRPAPYNIVLEDGTYEGEIKIGLKFISNVDMQLQTERRDHGIIEKQPQPFYRKIFRFTFRRIPWPRFHIFQNHTNLKESQKSK